MKKGRTWRPLVSVVRNNRTCELSGDSGELELMPVSWADGMERYSCTGRDLLRRYARCYPYSVIPSNSGELKSFKLIKHHYLAMVIPISEQYQCVIYKKALRRGLLCMLRHKAGFPPVCSVYLLPRSALFRPLSRCGSSPSPAAK